MRTLRWRHSLKSRIVVSYSLILILGGLSTSMIGIQVTGRALMKQARQQMVYGLSAARNIYLNRVRELGQSVELLASSGRLQEAVATDQPDAVAAYLAAIRAERNLDFLSVTDASGRVIVRTSGPRTTGDIVRSVPPIARALQGHAAAGAELVSREMLGAEDPALAERANIVLQESPAAKPTDQTVLQTGMALLAAAPAMDETGRVIAVVYAGHLLNNSDTDLRAVRGHSIVEKINATLAPAPGIDGPQPGVATILQDDVRVSTNITTRDQQRAVGTRVAEEVYTRVIGEGRPWIGRTFGIEHWYITGYDPITNLGGERIGMLGVGLLERPYTAVRDQVTLIFAGIALFCFLLIVIVTYFLTRSLVRPLEEMVSVSKSIAAEDLTQRVSVNDRSELGMLAVSFNDMLDRISEMKSQLEQWGKTLEHKVEQRTQQLVKVQTQVARQQRLASVGQLAAGVAHEINNPLGGILTFASLVLEDVPEDSPYREDLEEIVRQAVRCRKIVTELLEFSRQREAQMTSADINAVASRTLAMLEKQALFHDINVTRDFAADMPPTVMDESQMQQVFMNIILNAVHAMEERGDLSIRTWHEKGEQVFVRITDTGCGIPPEIREAIFDPFFTTKDPGKGTGLGLAVACRIVQNHGGRTEVESEVSKGTSFTIMLPVRGESPPPTAEEVSSDEFHPRDE